MSIQLNVTDKQFNEMVQKLEDNGWIDYSKKIFGLKKKRSRKAFIHELSKHIDAINQLHSACDIEVLLRKYDVNKKLYENIKREIFLLDYEHPYSVKEFINKITKTFWKDKELRKQKKRQIYNEMFRYVVVTVLEELIDDKTNECVEIAIDKYTKSIRESVAIKISYYIIQGVIMMLENVLEDRCFQLAQYL